MVNPGTTQRAGLKTNCRTSSLLRHMQESFFTTGFTFTRRHSRIASATSFGSTASTTFDLHDLRHCAATGMAKLGVPSDIRERVLNQVTGRRQSLGARYDQHEYLAEKRDALARWEAHLLSIVSQR